MFGIALTNKGDQKITINKVLKRYFREGLFYGKNRKSKIPKDTQIWEAPWPSGWPQIKKLDNIKCSSKSTDTYQFRPQYFGPYPQNSAPYFF